MNTLAALEHYNSLCDEIDSFMNDENAHLRSSGSEDARLAERKSALVAKLDTALQRLRAAGPVKSADHAASCEARKRVLAKIMKLLLLSRESEQLLLKNSVRSMPRFEAPQPSASRLASTYKAHKPAPKTVVKPAPKAESSWVVW
jgi:flagellar biosynthesis/type III secretory pathway chaperone